jgi:uncharacterized membrane protein
MIFWFGTLILVVVALVYELVQGKRKHKQNNVLYEVYRQSETLKNTVTKNGGWHKKSA